MVNRGLGAPSMMAFFRNSGSTLIEATLNTCSETKNPLSLNSEMVDSGLAFWLGVCWTSFLKQAPGLCLGVLLLLCVCCQVLLSSVCSTVGTMSRCGRPLWSESDVVWWGVAYLVCKNVASRLLVKVTASMVRVPSSITHLMKLSIFFFHFTHHWSYVVTGVSQLCVWNSAE